VSITACAGQAVILLLRHKKTKSYAEQIFRSSPSGISTSADASTGARSAPSFPIRQRAPLVRYAFEAFASGEYTLHTLRDQLTDLGLTNCSSRSRPERPLRLFKLSTMTTSVEVAVRATST
jgi:hypothetical protein